jgi:hypothetical protein
MGVFFYRKNGKRFTEKLILISILIKIQHEILRVGSEGFNLLFQTTGAFIINEI